MTRGPPRPGTRMSRTWTSSAEEIPPTAVGTHWVMPLWFELDVKAKNVNVKTPRILNLVFSVLRVLRKHERLGGREICGAQYGKDAVTAATSGRVTTSYERSLRSVRIDSGVGNTSGHVPLGRVLTSYFCILLGAESWGEMLISFKKLEQESKKKSFNKIHDKGITQLETMMCAGRRWLARRRW